MYNNRIELLQKLKYITLDLVNYGFTLKEFKQAGFSIHDLIYHGFNIKIFEDYYNNYLNPPVECDCTGSILNNLISNAGYTFEEIREYFDKEEISKKLAEYFKNENRK
jgi:hypothetical protein